MAANTPVNPSANWHPNWLSNAFSQKIFDALGEANTRFVGGAIRDSLLGFAVKDIDMATSHLPGQTQALLEAVGIKTIATGIQHGTITAVWNGEAREITTLRRDIETDGRHATVAFTDDWAADAARRDFTINALYAGHDGQIYDPCGGLADLEAGRVRFIGDAESRIKEDALRIYRFFRFSARFGVTLDAVGLSACKACASDVGNLSRERVRDELLKLLMVAEPLIYLQAMQKIRILPMIGDVEADVDAFRQLLAAETANDSQTAPETRLSKLYSPAAAKVVARSFRLSGKQKDFMETVRQADTALLSADTIDPLLYRFGKRAVAEALKSYLGEKRPEFILRAESWQRPVFPVSGEDLKIMGFREGKEMGVMLGELEGAWIASGFSLSKDDLLKAIVRK